MAQALLTQIHQLGAEDITEVVSVIEELDDKTLANKVLTGYSQALEKRYKEQAIDERFLDYTHRKLHPVIEAKIIELRDRQNQKLLLFEACDLIFKNSGWGKREKNFRQLNSKRIPIYTHRNYE